MAQHSKDDAGDLREASVDKPLDPYTVEILRQKTLYKMQRDLWRQYESEWNKFTASDHLVAKAPIPPNCRILPLHIYLSDSNLSLKHLRAIQGPLQIQINNAGSPTPETITSAGLISVHEGQNSVQSQYMPIDIPLFEECYKEAKRRLQMCSFRIIDENALICMKEDIRTGYEQILSSSAPSRSEKRPTLGNNIGENFESFADQLD